MKGALMLTLIILMLTASACTDSPMEPTPNLAATIQAGIEATRTSEDSLEATIEARVAATLAAIQPIPSPDEERIIRLLYQCKQNSEFVEEALGFEKGFFDPLPQDWQTFLAAYLSAFESNPSVLANLLEGEERLSLVCADE